MSHLLSYFKSMRFVFKSDLHKETLDIQKLNFFAMFARNFFHKKIKLSFFIYKNDKKILDFSQIKLKSE